MLPTTFTFNLCVCVCVCVCVCTCIHAHARNQSCLNPCDRVDCSLPGSSVHGISQARILEWVAISFSRGSSRPRDRTCVSWVPYIPRWILYHCATLAELLSDGWKVDWTTSDQCTWVCWLEDLAMEMTSRNEQASHAWVWLLSSVAMSCIYEYKSYKYYSVNIMRINQYRELIIVQLTLEQPRDWGTDHFIVKNPALT